MLGLIFIELRTAKNTELLFGSVTHISQAFTTPLFHQKYLLPFVTESSAMNPPIYLILTGGVDPGMLTVKRLFTVNGFAEEENKTGFPLNPGMKPRYYQIENNHRIFSSERVMDPSNLYNHLKPCILPVPGYGLNKINFK